MIMNIVNGAEIELCNIEEIIIILRLITEIMHFVSIPIKEHL